MNKKKYEKEFQTLDKEGFVKALMKKGMAYNNAHATYSRYVTTSKMNDLDKARFNIKLAKFRWRKRIVDERGDSKRPRKPNDYKLSLIKHLKSIGGLTMKNLYKWDFNRSEMLWVEKNEELR